MRRLRDESGAAAVEFALVMPLLVLLVMGIVSFGRAYQTQAALAAAAREGVRVMAVRNDPAAARAAAEAVVGDLSPALSDSQIAISPSVCAPGQTATVTASYPITFLTPMVGSGVTLHGKGTMLCGG